MWWGQTKDSEEPQPESNNSVTETDLTDQIEQQQHLITQLKDLVRQNEQKLQEKDSELQEHKTKLSKLKIQHKAKIAQLTSQLNETQKRLSDVTEQSTETSLSNKKTEEEEDTPSDTISSHTSEQSQRGRVLMLKKKLEETRTIFEKKEKEMQLDRQEAEKLVENLKTQLHERDQTITTLQSSLTSKTAIPVDDPNTNEMYSQVVYKDNKIMELNQQILQLEGKIMDLQENLREKDEVIKARNKAIQLMTEDLSRRGKTVVDQLDDTRDEMRLMQRNFAEYESIWNEEREGLKRELESSKEKFQLEISEKENKMMDLKDTIGKLESARYELSTKNAALQEKLVLLQEKIQQIKRETASSSNEKIEGLLGEISKLKTNLQEKESVISSLQQIIDETSSKNDGSKSTVKIRAQYVSRIKLLEKRLKEIQDTNQDKKLLQLQKQITDLEEEKQTMQLKLVEFEDLKNNKDKFTSEAEEINMKLSRQSDELTNHIRMVSLLEKDKLDLAASLAEQRKETMIFKEANVALKSRLEELEDFNRKLEGYNNENIHSKEIQTIHEDQKEFKEFDDEITKEKSNSVGESMDFTPENIHTIISRKPLVMEINSSLHASDQQELTATEKQQKIKELLKNFCEKHELTELSNNEMDKHWKKLLDQQQQLDLQVKTLCEIANVKDVAELHHKWEELQSRNSSLESSLLQRENELMTMTKKCAELEEKLKNLDTNSKTEKDHLNLLIQNQLAINEELKINLDQKNAELSELEKELQNSLDDKNNLEEEIKLCNLRIEELEKETQQLNTVINENTLKFANTQYDLSLKEKQLEEYKNDLFSLNEKYNVIAEESSQKEIIITELRSEIQTLQNDKMLLENMMDAKTTLESKNQSFSENIVKLENEVLCMKTLIEEKESIISTLHLESKKLNQEMEDLKHNLQNEREKLILTNEEKDMKIHNLEEQIAEQNKMQFEDKEKIAESEYKWKHLEDELKMKSNSIKELEQHLEIRNNDYTVITQKLQDIIAENDNLKMSIADKHYQLETMQETSEMNLEKLKITSTDLDFMKKICDEKESSVREFQNQLEQQSSIISNLEEDKKNLEDLLKCLENDFKKETERVKEKSESLLEENQQLLEKVATIEYLQQHIQELEMNEKKFEEEINGLRKENDHMQNLIVQHCSKIECLNKELDEKTLVSVNVCNELDETQAKLLKVMEALEESEASYNKVSSQFQEQATKIEELNCTIDDKNNKIEQLQREQTRDKEELNEIREKWESLKIDFDQLEMKLNDKTQEMQELKEKLAESNKLNDSHKFEQTEVIEKLNILSNNVSLLEKEKEALFTSKTKYEEIIASQRKDLEDKDRQLVELNSELVNIKLAFQSAQEQISSFQDKLHQLKDTSEKQLRDSENNLQLQLKIADEKIMIQENQLKDFSSQLESKEKYIEQILLEADENNARNIKDNEEIKISLDSLKEKYELLENTHSQLNIEKLNSEKRLEEFRIKTEFLTNSLQESIDSSLNWKLQFDTLSSEYQTFKNNTEIYINNLKDSIHELENRNREIILMADSGKDESLNQVLKAQNEIMDLEKIITSLRKEMEIIKKEQNNQQENTEKILNENEILQEQCNILHDKNKELNETVLKFQSDNNKLNSQLAELNELLQNLTQNNFSLEENLQKYKNSLDVISGENKSLENEIVNLLQKLMEVEELERDRYENIPIENSSELILNTFSKLTVIIDKILLANEQKKNSIEDLQNQMENLQTVINQRESGLQQALIDIDILKNTVSSKEKEISLLENNLKSHLEKDEDNQICINKFRLHIQQLQNEIEIYCQTINELRSDNAEKDEMIQKLKSDTEINLAKIESLEKMSNENNELLKIQDKENEHSQLQIQELQQKLSSEIDRNNELEKHVNKLNEENHSINSSNLELNHEIDLLKAENEMFSSKISTLNDVESELNAEKEKYLLLLKSLEELRNVNIDLEEKIKNYESKRNENANISLDTIDPSFVKYPSDVSKWNDFQQTNEEMEMKVNQLSKTIEELNSALVIAEETKKDEIKHFQHLLAEEKELQRQNLLEITSLKNVVQEAKNELETNIKMIQLLGNGLCQVFSIIEGETQVNTKDFISVYFEEGNSTQMLTELISKLQYLKQSNVELQFRNDFMADTVEMLTKEKETLMKQSEQQKHSELNTDKQVSTKRKELDVLEFIDNIENHWTNKNTLGQGDGSGNHLEMNTSHPQDHISSLLQENARLKDELEDVKDKLCCLISQIETPKMKKITPLGMAENDYKRDLGAFPRDESVPDLLVNQPVTELVSEISSSYIQQLKHSEEAIMVLKKDIEMKEEMLIQIKNEFTGLQTKLTSVQQNLSAESQSKNECVIELNEMKLINENLKDRIKHLEEELNSKSNVISVQQTVSLHSPSVGTTNEKTQGSNISVKDVEGNSKLVESNETEDINQVEKLKNELGLMKIRNGKMLAKLKQFKDKNDKLQQELNELNTRLSSEKKQIDDTHQDLIDNNSCLKEQINVLEREIKVLNERIVETSTELEKEKANNNILSETKDKFQSEVINLKELLKQQSVELDEAQKVNTLLSNEKSKLTIAITEINEQTELLESDNNSYQVLVENLKSSKLKLEEELKQHLSLLYHVREEKGLLEAENSKLNALKEQYVKLKEEEEKFEKASLSLMKSEEIIDSLQERINHLEEIVAVLREEKVDLELKVVNEEGSKQIMNKYDEEMKELKNKCCNYEEEIDDLKKREKNFIDELRKLNTSSLGRKDESTMTINKIESFNNDLIWPNNSSHNLLGNQEFLVETKIDKLQHVESESYQLTTKTPDENEHLIHKLNELLKNNEEKDAENIKLKKELNELILSLKKSEMESEERQQEKNELQVLVNKWQKSFEDRQAEIEFQKSLYHQLQTENHDLMNRINELQKLVSQIQETSRQKENELLQAINKIDTKEKEIVRLSEQLRMTLEENNQCKDRIAQLQLAAGESSSKQDSDLQTVTFTEINHLKAELQQTIQALHHRDYRCEQLTEEITRLLEERDSLQLRLSTSLKDLNFKDTHIQRLQRELEEKLHPIIDHHNEVSIPINEEHYPLMLPATDFSLTRTVASPSWRIRNWLLGRSFNRTSIQHV